MATPLVRTPGRSKVRIKRASVRFAWVCGDASMHTVAVSVAGLTPASPPQSHSPGASQVRVPTHRDPTSPGAVHRSSNIDMSSGITHVELVEPGSVRPAGPLEGE